MGESIKKEPLQFQEGFTAEKIRELNRERDKMLIRQQKSKLANLKKRNILNCLPDEIITNNWEDSKLEDLTNEPEANVLLSEKEKEIFFNALLNPDEPNDSLKKAAKRDRDLNKLLNKANKKNIHKETDTGKPVENEEW